MPSPPSAKGRHTELQATRAPPLPGSAPGHKGTSPARVCPAPEKTPHDTLEALPHPYRHLKSRHEVRGDGREDCLHQDQAASAG